MKIRNGFVSNSSSSSYVIVVDEPILTVKDLEKYVMTKLYAKRIFDENLKNQKGTIICEPHTQMCDECKQKFVCFTNAGYGLAINYALWVGDSVEYVDFYANYKDYDKTLMQFASENKGRLAYFIRLRDSGDGGTVLDSSICEDAYFVLKMDKFCIELR